VTARPSAFRLACTPCRLRADRDEGHVQPRDAIDIAHEAIRTARQLRCAVALYVFPDRTVEIRTSLGDASALRAIDYSPTSLVGIYTRMADPFDVAADVLSMPRGES
jgi:hypothetical protein